MRLFGLLGYPLTHSFSPQYFKNKFLEEGITDADYVKFEEADLFQFVEQVRTNNTLVGFNITIPYKEGIINLLDSISNEASWIGAINTVKKVGNKLFGYNTDVYGFRKSLLPLLKLQHQRALILGTGGASKAVKFVLDELNIPHLFVSRSPDRGQIVYNQINEGILRNYTIVINTTPLGTFPHTDEAADLPYEYLSSSHLCYDLVYNPAKTTFLSLAEEQGATIKNGLEMLHLQAEKSWEIWNDTTVEP